MNFKTPVRKIKPTRRSVSGYFSFRGKEPTPYESTLERDFVMRMDYDRSVERVVSQPARLFYIDANGIERRYTPDYLVYFTNPVLKPLLVEVKEKREVWKTTSTNCVISFLQHSRLQNKTGGPLKSTMNDASGTRYSKTFRCSGTLPAEKSVVT